MNLIFLGAPGAGKGTQAAIIAEKYNLTLIGTGDLFRRAVAEKTDLGTKVQNYMQQGLLVPDELVFGILKQNLKPLDWERGLAFDGFPRTVAQAQELDTMVAHMNKKIDKTFFIHVPEDILIHRLINRWTCQSCSLIFGPQEVTRDDKPRCIECGGILVKRSDDTEETVKKRLQEYKQKTEPILSYYRAKKDILKQIDGSLTIQEVTDQLIAAIERSSSKSAKR